MEDFESILAKQGFAEEHQNEITSSRVGGFGGSDAKLFLTIARKGLDNLCQTDLKRIAIMMGLKEPDQHFDNKYTKAGHLFEEAMEPLLTTINEKIEREAKLEATPEFFANNFKLFAHADFYEPDIKKVHELKYVQKETAEVLVEYQAQLQWYYMLGCQQVSLVHGRGEVSPFTVASVNTFEIKKNDDIVKELMKGVVILDDAIQNGWQPVLKDTDDLPDEIACAIHQMLDFGDKIKRMQEQYDFCKDIVKKYMQGTDASKYSIEHEERMYTISLGKPTTSRSFDSKKFLKEHPEYNTDEWYKESQREGTFKVQ